MTTYRSPAGPPPPPPCPSPRSLRRDPVSTPGGILTLRLCDCRSNPWPPHFAHGSAIVLPRPLHCAHTFAMLKKPCWNRTWPEPRQPGHCRGDVPGLAPLPWQVSHVDMRGRLMVFSTPNAASSNVRSRLKRRSSPRRAAPRPPPLPRRAEEALEMPPEAAPQAAVEAEA